MNVGQKNGPPTDISSSELWAALSATERPWKVVDFPRFDPITKKTIGQLAIRVLTQEEQIVASAAADRQAKQLLKEAQKNGEENLGYQNVYNNEAAVQVLYLACRDVNDVTNSAFPTPTLLRKNLTVDEIGMLMVMYYQVQYEIGPIVAHMSEAEEKDWIGRLAEGGASFPIALLSPREQERLLISMASQLVNYWTDKSSAGSPHNRESPSDPDEDLPDTSPVEIEQP